MDWTAQIDQALAGAKDMAKFTAIYYQGLLDEGIDPDRAGTLTIGFISIVSTMPRTDEAADA